MCVRNEWRQGRTAILTPNSSLDHSSTSLSSWLVLLNRGSLRAQSPLSGAGSHFGILSPTDSNHLNIWLYYCLTSNCFCLFTQVHLLIDGSVEGQYITFPDYYWIVNSTASIKISKVSILQY